MPYLNDSRKKAIAFHQEDECGRSLIIDGGSIETPGDLNYAITMLAIDYIKKNGERYKNYNDVVGAIEGAKLEFYRRAVSFYEDNKIEENGDVYEL